MPIINIAVTTSPNAERSAWIAGKITELTRQHLRKDPTVTAVAVSHIDPNHWFAGGQSLAAQGVESFFLDIKVVDGTNTKGELADYMAAVFSAMGEALGGVHAESYVHVHEVSAAAYGFGGITQEYRYIKGRLDAA